MQRQTRDEPMDIGDERPAAAEPNEVHT